MSVYNQISTSQAASGSFFSSPIGKQQHTDFCVQANIAGTAPSGTFAIEASVDAILQTSPTALGNTANWFTVTSSAIAASGSIGLNLSKQNYPYFRIRWTNTGSSSDSTITCLAFKMGPVFP